MAIDKKINFEVQGGIKNYLGKQKEVKAPLKWQSSPDHPSTELAYITQAEKDLLIKQDLHGSLKGGANRGPSGIMSLNGWGDMGGSENAGTNDDGSSRGGGTGPSVEAPPGVTANPSAPTDGTERTLSDPREKFDYKVGDTVFGPIGNTGPSFIDKAINMYSKLPTPFNLAKNVLNNLGPLNNKNFYDQKVAPAGKTNLGFDDYMSARMAGNIDAYGNPTNNKQGQNALNERSGNLEGIESVVEVQNTGPVDYGPMEGMAYTAVEPQPGFRYIYDQYGRRSSIPIEGYTGTVNEAASINNDFNFGTYSNPIYSDDLV
jgi:hypothetical protein